MCSCQMMAGPTFLSCSLRHKEKKEKKVKAEADEDYWQDVNSLGAATGAESVAHKRSKWLVRPDQLCLGSFTVHRETLAKCPTCVFGTW